MPQIPVKPAVDKRTGQQFRVRNPVTGLPIRPDGDLVEHDRTIKRHLADKPPGLVQLTKAEWEQVKDKRAEADKKAAEEAQKAAKKRREEAKKASAEQQGENAAQAQQMREAGQATKGSKPSSQ